MTLKPVLLQIKLVLNVVLSWRVKSFFAYCLRPVDKLFQIEFSTECDLVLYRSVFSILFSVRSSSSCLRLLARFLVPSVFPSAICSEAFPTQDVTNPISRILPFARSFLIVYSTTFSYTIGPANIHPSPAPRLTDSVKWTTHLRLESR